MCLQELLKRFVPTSVRVRRGRWFELFTRGTALLTILVACVATPFASAALKGAYVEQVLPGKPFSATVSMGGPFNAALSAGTGPLDAGVLGVTSLTITNFNTEIESLAVFNGDNFYASCSHVGYSQVGTISTSILIPPKQTLHIDFPSPLVITPLNGKSCLYFSRTGNGGLLQILVNGFTN